MATTSVVNYIKQDAVVSRVNELLKDRAPQFLTTLTTAINESQKLSECEPASVLTAALTAAGLDLSVNPNLGFAYLIPYSKKAKITNEQGKTEWVTTSVCQFQMGYKGFIQLAQRSGYYKTINATDVREGEIKNFDRLSGEIEFEWINDQEERSSTPVVGYVAYFKLLNGFEKMYYMTAEQLEGHAKKYSKSYAKYSDGLWKDDFDSMAKKTVLKLLISKYGPQSTQMQDAIKGDQMIDNEYADNPNTVVMENAEIGSSEEMPDGQEDNNNNKEDK
jgi:recombination protein RecT